MDQYFKSGLWVRFLNLNGWVGALCILGFREICLLKVQASLGLWNSANMGVSMSRGASSDFNILQKEGLSFLEAPMWSEGTGVG